MDPEWVYPNVHMLVEVPITGDGEPTEYYFGSVNDWHSINLGGDWLVHIDGDPRFVHMTASIEACHPADDEVMWSNLGISIDTDCGAHRECALSSLSSSSRSSSSYSSSSSESSSQSSSSSNSSSSSSSEIRCREWQCQPWTSSADYQEGDTVYNEIVTAPGQPYAYTLVDKVGYDRYKAELADSAYNVFYKNCAPGGTINFYGWVLCEEGCNTTETGPLAQRYQTWDPSKNDGCCPDILPSALCVEGMPDQDINGCYELLDVDDRWWRGGGHQCSVFYRMVEADWVGIYGNSSVSDAPFIGFRPGDSTTGSGGGQWVICSIINILDTGVAPLGNPNNHTLGYSPADVTFNNASVEELNTCVDADCAQRSSSSSKSSSSSSSSYSSLSSETLSYPTSNLCLHWFMDNDEELEQAFKDAQTPDNNGDPPYGVGTCPAAAKGTYIPEISECEINYDGETVVPPDPSIGYEGGSYRNWSGKFIWVHEDEINGCKFKWELYWKQTDIGEGFNPGEQRWTLYAWDPVQVQYRFVLLYWSSGIHGPFKTENGVFTEFAPITMAPHDNEWYVKVQLEHDTDDNCLYTGECDCAWPSSSSSKSSSSSSSSQSSAGIDLSLIHI